MISKSTLRRLGVGLLMSCAAFAGDKAKPQPKPAVHHVEPDGVSSALMALDDELTCRYGSKERREYLLFGPDGSLWSRPPATLDRADMLEIHVLAWANQRDAYSVAVNHRPDYKRKQAPGKDVPVSPGVCPSKRPPELTVLTWIAGPFAPGAVRVAVRAPQSALGPVKGKHAVDLHVRKLSSFMLRPAILGSNLQDESYSFQGGTLRKRFTTDPINGALALVWFRDPAGVDLKNMPKNWWNRINPMVGIPFDRLGDRWYLGLNVLVAPGFDLNLGFQFEEVDRLSRTMPIGVENGALVARTESRWKSSPFFGVSFDAVTLLDRAAKFFRDVEK